MALKKKGTKAPDFKLPSDTGEEIRLKDFRGKKVILYFYPKDSTSGWTREAIEFRDELAKIKRKKAVVLGVSKDSVASHQKFKEKQKLNFPLLSDPDLKALKAYGAWQKKKMYGKEVMGTVRSTFIIDQKGIIQAVWDKVKVDGHVAEVLKAL